MLHDLDSGRDIARHVERLLRDAEAQGRLPTPVDDLIAAAKLTEPLDSLLSESALAGVPEYLAAKMRRLRGKTHALLDRKTREIHVNPDISHDGQRRFKKCHEVAHDILPWQQDTGYVDDQFTLAPTTRRLFEQEANQGGAELLFQRDLFTEMASDYRMGFATVLDLAEQFGASYHATFRRYVETHGTKVAGLVLEPSPCTATPLGYRRGEALNSTSWMTQFDPTSSWPQILNATPYSFIQLVRTVGDEAVTTTLRYPDLNNTMTDLNVELWSNTYRVFVLIWKPRRERLKRARVVIAR